MTKLYETVLHFPNGSKTQALMIHATTRQEAMYKAGQLVGFGWSKLESKETQLPTAEQIKKISLAMGKQPR